MHVIESRTSSSFCTSTRMNCSKKQHQEFCYITRENKRALHEFSKLYECNDFTSTVLRAAPGRHLGEASGVRHRGPTNCRCNHLSCAGAFKNRRQGSFVQDATQQNESQKCTVGPRTIQIPSHDVPVRFGRGSGRYHTDPVDLGWVRRAPHRCGRHHGVRCTDPGRPAAC